MKRFLSDVFGSRRADDYGRAEWSVHWPLVAGTVFPMPRDLNLKDRPYFRFQESNAGLGLYIGDVATARVTNERGNPRFFALSRKRIGPDGKFSGVTVISVSPDYFTEYYSRLPRPGIAALYRADGAILARYPEPPPQFQRLPAAGPLTRVMRAGTDTGDATPTNASDGR